jgi:hypothetical protein
VLVVVWVGPFDGAEDIGLGVGSIVSVGGVVFGELVFGARVGGEMVQGLEERLCDLVFL